MPEDRLRVALFTDSALPILNGVSVSIDALVTELRNRGHSVHVYTNRVRSYRDTDPNTFRFRALETPWSRGYPIAIPPFWRKLRVFRKHEYDLVHTHSPWTVGFVGLRWAESHDLPVVSTYHTLYDRYHHYIPGPRRYIRFKIAKHTNWYYNHVDHVITPTDAAMKWLRRHSVQTPVTVIPTGSPGRAFFDRSEVRQSLGIPPDQKVMLYVGRLAKEKNLETLFESVQIAFRADPLLRLWLVGDGPYRQECMRQVRQMGIGDRVRFVGFVPRSEVDKFYAASDVFVFASVTETQGLVIQEAMTYGLPAIAVVGGGASEGIVDGVNGFAVQNDPEQFAQTLLHVMGNELLYTHLSEGASRSVRSRGTSEMCESVLGVYRTVIEQRRNTQVAGSYAWI
jgi:glycosyltransferase involved in cell wall biosynthesis